MTCLKFVEGQFFLEDPPSGCRVHALDFWTIVNERLYVTHNIRAAVEFRRFSDETCERVFNRALNKLYSVPTLPPLTFLDPHQVEGVKWILSRKRSYLCHAPGAGKTVQAVIAAHLAEPLGQTLFIVPPTLTANWVREIERFTFFGDDGRTAVVPLSAKRDEMDWSAPFIVCPDSMLDRPWVHRKLNKRWKLIAVDEASRFKESTSQRSRIFFGGVIDGDRYFGLYQSARHVVFLDGSPMPNRPMELWAPTFALDPLAIDGMDQKSFGFRYCGAQVNERGQWEYKGSCREDELHQKIARTFMHFVYERELKHPERRRSLLVMNEDVRTREHREWDRKNFKRLDPDNMDEKLGQGEMAHYRAELGRRKIPFIVRYISERLKEKAESILLFVWHRDVAQELTRKLQSFKPGLVMGGTNKDERERIFDGFQEGKIKLIIGNIQAMGRGHNLQRADRIVFGEFSWTDELNKQCEKRASRRGRDQAKTVRCEYIVCPDSIDEKVLSSVFTKERRVKRVIG